MFKIILNTNPIVSWLVVLAFVVLGSGCAGLPERNPLPMELTSHAGIPGVPEARYWIEEWPKYSVEKINVASEDDPQFEFSGIYNKPHNYLAISGGGANGAFGAGLLVGWTQAGSRPEFTMVTGISTGALAAPFAFLGSDYDDTLEKMYTTISTKDLLSKRGGLTVISGDSLFDTAPLRALISRYINSDVIEAIAREHARGRRLNIGTVNLDAGRNVIWNIGAIAASDYPLKEELIQSVILASSSIPIAFPPVIIPVEANGLSYDEMHVDGGVGTQVFVYPAVVNWKMVTESLKVQGQPRIFVIRNSFLELDYKATERKILPIAMRAVDSLIRTQGIGDLYQIYALCTRDGNDFNLAYIPEDFDEESVEGFDPVYMGKLFDYGFQKAKDGYPWQKWPYGYHLEIENTR